MRQAMCSVDWLPNGINHHPLLTSMMPFWYHVPYCWTSITDRKIRWLIYNNTYWVTIDKCLSTYIHLTVLLHDSKIRSLVIDFHSLLSNCPICLYVVSCIHWLYCSTPNCFINVLVRADIFLYIMFPYRQTPEYGSFMLPNIYYFNWFDGVVSLSLSIGDFQPIWPLILQWLYICNHHVPSQCNSRLYVQLILLLLY